MIDIKQCIYLGSIKEILDNYYYILDHKKWLYESYKDYCITNNIIPNQNEEKHFYASKCSEYYVNLPSYWIWQEALYENFSSIKSSLIFIKKLLYTIDAIHDIKYINDNILKIYILYSKNFDVFKFNSILLLCNGEIIEKQTENDLCILTISLKAFSVCNERYDILYYLTSKSSYNEILQYGILPRTNEEFGNYTNRIYLFKTLNDVERCKFIYNDPIILKVDVKKFKAYHDVNIKLFEDDSKTIFYTEEPIQTKYINII